MNALEFVELVGEPYEKGIIHGRQLRSEIHANYRSLRDSILSQPAAQRRGVTGEEDLLTFCRRYMEPAEAYSPVLFAEMNGIAAASGLDPVQVMMLNVHLELIDLTNARAPDPPTTVEGGCTDLGVELPNGGGCILAQTYDLQCFYESAAFVFRSRTNGLDVCGLSFAGTLGANGMNSLRFGVIINKLYGNDSRAGVPYPFIVRAALEENTPGRSISRILGAERAGSMHYLCGDSAGVLYPIETTATRWDMLEAEGGTYVHTNHFQAQRFRDSETRDFREANSHTVIRYQRARQLIRRIGPSGSNEDYADLLCDGHNAPLAISSINDGQVRTATVAKSLFNTATGEIYFSRGTGPLQQSHVAY